MASVSSCLNVCNIAVMKLCTVMETFCRNKHFTSNFYFYWRRAQMRKSENKCLDYTVDIPRNVQHVIAALGDPNLR